MSYSIITSENFVKELKRLAKRYPSIKQDMASLGETLVENPIQGSPLGRNCYKIRLAIKSKGRGKRGGSRVITCVIALQESVTLLSIFDKADQATISDQELERLLTENDLA